MRSLTIEGLNPITLMDWEFVNSDTSYATHDFHRYPSKFIPQIASNLIKLFSKKGETVFDSFVGSGTTLVESKILGRNSIGIDINPLACLISKVKSTQIKEALLDKSIKSLLNNIRDWIYSERQSTQKQLNLCAKQSQKITIPQLPFFEQWFQPQVLKELSIITEEIKKIENTDLKEFAICALSAIIRSVSNAKSGFGNLMIDKEKRIIKNTFEIFENQILKMIEGMKEFNNIANRKSIAKVYQGDARNISFIKEATIDLIVTHPPYIASVPYAEYQKLSMNWLRESFPEMFNGAYAENMHPKNLDKNIIGGRRGRKDVVDRFLVDIKRVLEEMFRVLKKKKYCCIVIGNPVVFGKEVFLNEILTDLAKGCGFSIEEEIIRGKYKTTMGKMKKEYILIFRKDSKC
jgi:site-specific DNA-methyltransferase (cytosine-N4-specific)